MIEHLPVLSPDTARVDRTVARCHDALARRRLRVEAAARRRARSYVIERAVVAGVSVIYLIAMAGDVVALYW
jgi:hypothetical protein